MVKRRCKDWSRRHRSLKISPICSKNTHIFVYLNEQHTNHKVPQLCITFISLLNRPTERKYKKMHFFRHKLHKVVQTGSYCLLYNVKTNKYISVKHHQKQCHINICTRSQLNECTHQNIRFHRLYSFYFFYFQKDNFVLVSFSPSLTVRLPDVRFFFVFLNLSSYRGDCIFQSAQITSNTFAL